MGDLNTCFAHTYLDTCHQGTKLLCHLPMVADRTQDFHGQHGHLHLPATVAVAEVAIPVFPLTMEILLRGMFDVPARRPGDPPVSQ
jgi:hypothetical protein